MFEGRDYFYMERALKLAEKGLGFTSPNPAVGAVIVKDGVIVGEGYHSAIGKPHAEVEALRMAGEKAKGATIYLNLEPCCHYGHTPPCTNALISAGIKKVVASIKDPNPLVNGKGFEILKNHGIEVQVGLLKDEAIELNSYYLKYITKKEPYITLKAGMSIDGKIATFLGDTKYISCDEALILTHRWRAQSDALIIGVNTIINDDPLLTVRHIKHKKNPATVIFDTYLRTPLNARTLSPDLNKRNVIFTGYEVDEEKIRHFSEKGVEVIKINSKDGKIDIKEALKILVQKNLINIMIEGGGELNFSFLKENMIDKIELFISPMIIGGSKATTLFDGEGFPYLKDAPKFYKWSINKYGDNILFVGYLKKLDLEI